MTNQLKMHTAEASSEGPQTNEVQSNLPIGEKCEIKSYHVTIKHGQTSKVPTSDPFGKGNSHGQDDPYALVIRKEFQEHKPVQTSLQVNSPYIQRAFRDVVKSYVMVPSDFTSSLVLQAPFEMLAHYWDELDEYRQSADETTKEHLDLLFEFMEHEVRPGRELALKMIQKQQIAYDNAWFIYRPGDILYTEISGHPWLLVCEKTAYEDDPNIGPYFEVHCSYADDNGVVVGEAPHVVVMNKRGVFPAGNAVAITGLEIYPRALVKEGESLERRLEARGKKFLAMKDLSTVAYGTCLTPSC